MTHVIMITRTHIAWLVQELITCWMHRNLMEYRTKQGPCDNTVNAVTSCAYTCRLYMHIIFSCADRFIPSDSEGQ